MTVATNANVTRLYIATFDRAPDSNGLNYWVNQSGLSLEQIAQSFFDQPETQAKYAGKTNQEFVETIYLNVLGRPGEAAGVAYWVGQLNAGVISKDQAILAVIGGAQGTDAELLEYKTEVGIYYAQQNSDKDAFAVIDEVSLDPASVGECKEWIDGKLPTAPSQYFVLDDNRTGYDLTGSAKDDVFVVEAFKNAKIAGGEGSDTLDFQDFSPKGVSVNLSTGLGPNGADGSAMKFEWIENIRGTSGNDTLVGNSDANILVAMGGVDYVDGGVGNDRIMFRNIADVAASTINGGQNTDTLEITDQTDISVGAATFANVSDVEILQVGYDEEGVPSAATITVTGGTPLNTFKEIRGTESYDKKGVAAKDVIQSALNLDVSRVKLTSIEELKMTAAEDGPVNTAGKITVGKDTLTSVKAVTGHEASKTTDLILSATTGDVFDLTMPTFANIDRVAQIAGPNAVAPVATTVIVNQSLINSLATADAADGFGAALAAAGNVDGGAAGGFTLSTLRASGIGLDLGALRDGDTDFKSIEFGTAKEVTVGNINDSVNAAAIAAAVAAVPTAAPLAAAVTAAMAAGLSVNATTGGLGAAAAADTVGAVAINALTAALAVVPAPNQATISSLVAALNAQLPTVAAGAAAAAAGSAAELAVDAAINAANVADLTALRSIVGSDNDSDLLRILPDKVGAQDLTYVTAGVRTGISITKVERLDFEETSTVAMMNANLTDVKQISGDNDRVGIVNDVANLNDNGTLIDAGYETATGGLNLKGKTIHDIRGLGNNVSGKNGTVTIDNTTTWDSNFKSLDHDSNQTIIAANAGSYDFSSILEASGAQIAFALKTGAPTITYFDKFVGSDGNDVVKGGADSFAYQLGKGDDTFIGTDTANELVEGGEGNDNIALGDNLDVLDTLNLWNSEVTGTNTGRLINSLSLGGVNDYVAASFNVGRGTVGPNATFLSLEDGGYADGGAGDDVITSGKFDDVLVGGTGNDTIKAGDGWDIVSAGDGDDILSGGDGSDYLAAGAGNDLIEGNAGEDYLFGGKGRDVLRGDELDAAGAIAYLSNDHFLFEAGDSGSTEQTVDIIKDFLSSGLAATLDLDGNGIKGDEGRVDTLYMNWFGTVVPAATRAVVAGDTTGTTAADTSGAAYGTFTADVGNTAVGTTLEEAANSALDRAYAASNLHTALAANVYTSQAVQFEYGGKEYVVIDSYVTGNQPATPAGLAAGQAANNYSATNDLIVEIADTAVSWSVSANDIVVTRWDAPIM